MRCTRCPKSTTKRLKYLKKFLFDIISECFSFHLSLSLSCWPPTSRFLVTVFACVPSLSIKLQSPTGKVLRFRMFDKLQAFIITLSYSTGSWAAKPAWLDHTVPYQSQPVLNHDSFITIVPRKFIFTHAKPSFGWSGVGRIQIAFPEGLHW